MEFSGSAATDGDDDFELIARRQRRFTVQALRDDFAVSLDGDALAGVSQMRNERRDGQRGRKQAVFAIDLDLQHPRILTKPRASGIAGKCKNCGAVYSEIKAS